MPIQDVMLVLLRTDDMITSSELMEYIYNKTSNRYSYSAILCYGYPPLKDTASDAKKNDESMISSSSNGSATPASLLLTDQIEMPCRSRSADRYPFIIVCPTNIVNIFTDERSNLDRGSQMRQIVIETEIMLYRRSNEDPNSSEDLIESRIISWMDSISLITFGSCHKNDEHLFDEIKNNFRFAKFNIENSSSSISIFSTGLYDVVGTYVNLEFSKGRMCYGTPDSVGQDVSIRKKELGTFVFDYAIDATSQHGSYSTMAEMSCEIYKLKFPRTLDDDDFHEIKLIDDRSYDLIPPDVIKSMRAIVKNEKIKYYKKLNGVDKCVAIKVGTEFSGSNRFVRVFYQHKGSICTQFRVDTDTSTADKYAMSDNSNYYFNRDTVDKIVSLMNKKDSRFKFVEGFSVYVSSRVRRSLMLCRIDVIDEKENNSINGLHGNKKPESPDVFSYLALCIGNKKKYGNFRHISTKSGAFGIIGISDSDLKRLNNGDDASNTSDCTVLSTMSMDDALFETKLRMASETLASRSLIGKTELDSMLLQIKSSM
jgi:hypothetical protein